MVFLKYIKRVSMCNRNCTRNNAYATPLVLQASEGYSDRLPLDGLYTGLVLYKKKKNKNQNPVIVFTELNNLPRN